MLTKFLNKTLYEILGVPPEASKEAIESAFQDMCRIYHPNSKYFQGIADDETTREHQQIYELICNAYNTLINDDARIAYDNKIFLDEHKNLFPGAFPQVELQQSGASIPAPRGPRMGDAAQGQVLVRLTPAGPRQLSPKEMRARQRKEKADEAWAANFPSMSQIIYQEQRSVWRTAAITLLGAVAGAAGGIIVYKLFAQLLEL